MLDINDWVQFLGTVILIVSIIITFYFSYNTLKELKNQLKLTIFTDYTKRYSEIVQKLPDNINYDSFKLKDENDTKKDKIMRLGRAYFDLCAEEYYLYSKKKIDDDTWKLWYKGIKYTFKLKGFKEIWEVIKIEGYDSEFIHFIGDLQKNRNF